MNSIEKGQLGENAVNHIVTQTYFDHWCYPSPKDESGDKKEICDLLVLFRDVAIIISVKNYSFDGNYERYFNSTLKKASKQIDGAERKLFRLERTINFKHHLTGLQSFHKDQYKYVYRIIINLNDIPKFYPAYQMSGKGKFLHIFNWSSFLKLTNELDTISDLVDYLAKREIAFAEKRVLFLLGEEEDLDTYTNQEFLKYNRSNFSIDTQNYLISGNELDVVAMFLKNDRQFNSIFFNSESNGINLQIDDSWKEFQETKESKNKEKENLKSYYLDEFIKKEILYYDNPGRIKIATEFLSLNRFERRMLSHTFFSFLEMYKDIKDSYTARRIGDVNNVAFGFFVHSNDIARKIAMELMKIFAFGYHIMQNFKNQKIIIIGLDVNKTQTKFLYLDEDFVMDEELINQTKKDLKMLNWFTNPTEIRKTYKEYEKDDH